MQYYPSAYVRAEGGDEKDSRQGRKRGDLGIGMNGTR